MKNLMFGLVAVTLMAVGSGCGKGSSTTTGQSDLSSQNKQFGGTNLQGTWKSDCIDVSNSGMNDALSMNGALSFAGNNVSATFSFYTDAKCKKPIFTELQQGGFLLNAAPDSTTNAPAIDYNINHETITYFDQKWIDNAKSGSKGSVGCDLSAFNFKVGTAEDVSSQEKCLHQESIGQDRYSVIKVDGNHLYMGESNDDDKETGQGEEASDRSTKLDMTYSFTRQ